MAPEKCLVAGLQAIFGAGYITADASPERYPHEQCLKLFFPNDYDIFPDQYFDVILHNHVLEHIPGSYKDHLPEFARILKPGGTMVLSIPGPYLDLDTKEGGEHFEDDKQRLKQFLQEDHFKVFGRDFEPFLASMAGGTLISDGIDDELRQSISVRPGKAPFFVWQKDR
jgi:SAM-dependent methyltransferase